MLAQVHMPTTSTPTTHTWTHTCNDMNEQNKHLLVFNSVLAELADIEEECPDSATAAIAQRHLLCRRLCREQLLKRDLALT